MCTQSAEMMVLYQPRYDNTVLFGARPGIGHGAAPSGTRVSEVAVFCIFRLFALDLEVWPRRGFFLSNVCNELGHTKVRLAQCFSWVYVFVDCEMNVLVFVYDSALLVCT
jgi:hypothetical protein